MEIKIKTNKHKFYRQVLELIRSIPPFSTLRPREIDVLAEIMYQFDKYDYIEEHLKPVLIFSTEVRKEMQKNIDIIEESYNNNLSILKKKKFIDERNNMMPFLQRIKYNKNFSLKFQFNGE